MLLGVTTAASGTDAAFHKKMFGSGVTTLIILNEEMNDILKIVKSLEESDLLIKGISKTVESEAKTQKCMISQYVIKYIRCYVIRKFVSR